MSRPKRAHHSGSITRRKDGRYEARLTLPDGNRRSFYGKTWGEAERKLMAARRDLEEGRTPSDARMTVAQLGQMWLDLAKEELALTTYENYRSKWVVHVEPVIGKVKLSRLSPVHVQNVLSEGRKRGLSAASVRSLRDIMAVCFAQGERWKLLAHNPARAVSTPRVRSRELPVTEREQVERLRDVIRTSRHEAALSLALGLGLRASELRALRWSDVDLEHSRIHIRNGVRTRGGPVVFGPLKTESSRRTLPLPAFLVAVLRRQRTAVLERRLAVGPAWTDYDLVLPGQHGRPIDPASWRGELTVLCARAGLPRLTIHHLRHLCATMLLMEGVAPKVVQAILGHSDVRMTMNVYTHLNAPLLDDAADAIDRLLGEASG